MLVSVRLTVELIEEGLGQRIDRKEYGQQMRITTHHETLEEMFAEYNEGIPGKGYTYAGSGSVLRSVIVRIADSLHECLVSKWKAPQTRREHNWEV